MDAGEIARQKASALHFAGASGGDDPTRPYAFAVGQAQRHGIDVDTSQAGAAILDGGRATFVAADALIIHENTGTNFERAFLVAHELGHALLGDDVRHVVFEVDPARSAEPSPVGVDRVTDYSRRQRREVQMDLFARELLLPRLLVKNLHLEQGLTATEIAARFDAPFAVVVQQLLDALLLPPVEAEPGDGRPPPALNPSQVAAAAHRGGPYLLEAGPGTGKTQTLAARIEGLLVDGADPRRMLVLTFSNKAAGELAERIGRKNPSAAAAMWIGTFHAFGLDLVRRFHGELGLPEDPRMLDRPEAVELFEDHFPKLRLRHFGDLYDPTRNISDLLAAVSRAKDEVVDAESYARLAQAMSSKAATEEEIQAAERVTEIAVFYEAYEAFKRKAACIDFGDLVALPVRLLEGSEGVCNTLRQAYEHVLVDEYQDVNRASVRLLKALCPTGKNLWVVGDVRQSIYRFRGASSYNVARFGSEDFVGGSRGALTTNYRSRREVVDAFSAFAPRMKAGSGVTPLHAERGACGHPPELRAVTNSTQQVAAVADAIEEMRAAGHPYRDQAVLCSGNERLAEVGRELEAAGIPVLFIGNLFDRPEVKDLLSVLSILVDGRAIGLVRIGCTADFPLSLPDVKKILDDLRENGGGDWSMFRDNHSLSTQSRTSIAALALALSGFDSTSQPWEVFAAFLLDRTRMAASLAKSAEVIDQTRGAAVWQFLNFVRTQPVDQGLPIRRLLDRVRRLVRLGDDRDLRRPPSAALGLDAVKLMTIHGAKGLEFPVVHMPGLNQDTFPGWSSGTSRCTPPDGMIDGTAGPAADAIKKGDEEERECLFYVGASRARERLFFYAVTQKSGGASRPISSFLQSLDPALKRLAVTPSRLVDVTETALAVDLRFIGTLRLSVSEIALYDSCPRRFLYTHVLRIGGRRVETNYMRMHEAVRSIVQAIVRTSTTTEVSPAEISGVITAAFVREGLDDPEAVVELHEAAAGMVRYFHAIRRDHTPEAPNQLEVKVGEDELTCQPDDVLVTPAGGRLVRIVRTGHKRDIKEDIGVAAHQIVAGHADATAAIELVFLADAISIPLSLNAKVKSNRQIKLAGMFAGIRSGNFQLNKSDRVCPGCPAFFICGPIPQGVLEIKI
jgi:superfamily I DNA/RNA helicase